MADPSSEDAARIPNDFMIVYGVFAKNERWCVSAQRLQLSRVSE